ncbi:MAG: hypothetical protein ACLSAP_01560 [Oscillospiraceae bacterium]
MYAAGQTHAFWTFLFPILLSVLFYLAFSNIAAEETFKKLPVAVVGAAAQPSFAR